MVTGTGIDGQFGYKGESVVGTEVTVDKFIQILSEGLKFDPSFIEPEGLRAGGKYKRGTQLAQARRQVSGPIELRYATRLMGGFWRAALGSNVTTPALIAGSAYKQVHQTGDLLGKSFTCQAGRPEPSGSVRPFTFRGCKVNSWEWSVSEGEAAKLKLDIDGWDESTSTALATAAYVTSSEDFFFTNAVAFTLGGAVAGTTELSVSGATTVPTVVKSISIKGENGLATDRIGLGSGGVKKEQLENDTPTVMIELDAEFDRTTFYDLFKAGTATPFYLRLDGSVISGTDRNSIEFLAPEIRIKEASPELNGPGIVQAKVTAEVYQAATGLNPFQVKLVSADSASII